MKLLGKLVMLMLAAGAVIFGLALLRETRLKTARTLLRGTTMHISEIAWSVGYPDALYFSRVFAASEGCSPSVYRAERRTPQGSAPQLYSPYGE